MDAKPDMRLRVGRGSSRWCLERALLLSGGKVLGQWLGVGEGGMDGKEGS